MKSRSFSDILKSCLVILFLTSYVYSNVNTVLWQKMYGGNNYDDPSSIVVHPDSGYAVLSSYQQLPNLSDLWLLRLNNKGDTMWTQQYGDSMKNELPVHLFIVPDGYLLMGTIVGSPSEESTWLLKCNSKGSIVWSRIFKKRNIRSSVFCKDSTIVLTGQYENKLFIMKVAQNGDSLFFKTFGDTTANTFGNSIIETNDSGYAIAGQCKISKSKACAILYRFDKNGDTMWISSTGSASGDGANDLFQLSDNSFIIAGSKVPSTSGNPRPFLQMISSVGTQVWEKNMIIDPYAQTIQKICILPNKNICTMGTKMRSNGSDISLLFYNLNGELIVAKDYGNFTGNQTYNYFRDFTMTSKTLVITACTQPVNGGQTLVFAVDYHFDGTGIEINQCLPVVIKNSHNTVNFSGMYNLPGQKLPSGISSNHSGPFIIKKSNVSKATMKLFIQ